jgi:hypothetical protein
VTHSHHEYYLDSDINISTCISVINVAVFIHMHRYCRTESDGVITINVYCVQLSKWNRGHFFSLSRRNARRRTFILTGHVPSITAAFICPKLEYESVSHPGKVFHVILICYAYIFTNISLPWRWRHCTSPKHLHIIITHNVTVRIIVVIV